MSIIKNSAPVPKAAPLSGKSSAYKFWMWTGILFLLGEAYVWLRWIFGPNFVRTPAGLDPITDIQLMVVYGYQIGVPILAVICIWFWVIRPWRREGRMTTDGMLTLCMAAVVFWDPSYNYASTGLLYNSHFVNFGSWTLGSWPGWISPAGNLLPEPILLTVPGYLALVFGQAVVMCWLMRKYKSWRPAATVFEIIFLFILSLTIMDSSIEIFLIRTGVYAYPAGIEGFTLFFGEPHQFPLNEGITFGGLGIGATAILMFFKNDRGETFIEAGLEKARYSATRKQWMKFCALFGYVHLTFFLFYFVPMNWFTMQADEYPEAMPDYLINGMCVYGVSGDQCPGPGVMMPRLEK